MVTQAAAKVTGVAVMSAVTAGKPTSWRTLLTGCRIGWVGPNLNPAPAPAIPVAEAAFLLTPPVTTVVVTTAASMTRAVLAVPARVHVLACAAHAPTRVRVVAVLTAPTRALVVVRVVATMVGTMVCRIKCKPPTLWLMRLTQHSWLRS
jgi:hypothetical protein